MRLSGGEEHLTRFQADDSGLRGENVPVGQFAADISLHEETDATHGVCGGRIRYLHDPSYRCSL
jgi:hypothetical protein